MLFTIAESQEGKMKVNGYYHQWGIGRIMPEAAMSAIIGCFRRDKYNSDFCENLTIGNAKGTGFRLEFSEKYEPGDKLAHYVWNNPIMIGEMACRHDNNNGALVVYAKEQSDGKEVDFRVGFLLGHEDAYSADYPDCNKENKALGAAFSRWLTFEEFSDLSVNDCITDNFKTIFLAFCKEYGVEIKSWNN